MHGICGLVAFNNFDETLPAFKRGLMALSSNNLINPAATLISAPLALAMREQHSGSCIAPLRTTQVLVADVRLDNRELLQPLLAPHDPAISDLELLAAAYERWGSDCVLHLRGEYAAAIWNHANQELFCFRDPLGHRPLYYTSRPGCFAFASQIKSLLPFPWVSGELEPARLVEFLGSLSVGIDHNLTYFRQIFRVLPGSTMTFSSTGIVTRSYWRPNPERVLPIRSRQDYIEEFRELFRRALVRRIGDRDRVGLCLSGGFDSSCIAIGAASILAERGASLHAFVSVASSGLPATPVDTHKICDALKRQLPNLEVHYCYREENTLLADPDLNAIAEAPLGPLGQRLHLLFRQARNQGIDVMLTGYGGDHAISPRGAGFLYDLLQQGQWANLWRESRARARLIGLPLWRTVYRELLVPTLPRWLWHSMLRIRDGSSPWREHILCTDAFARSAAVLNTLKRHPSRGFRRRPGMRAAGCEGLEYVQSGRGFDETFNLAWHSRLELCRPLLDLDLVEFALALPPQQHVRDGKRRMLLRDAFGEALPRELADRSEHNDFIVPDLGGWAATQQAEIANLLADLNRQEWLTQIVDTVRLNQLNRSWSGDPTIDLRTAMLLLRGLSGAHFAVWARDNIAT